MFPIINWLFIKTFSYDVPDPFQINSETCTGFSDFTGVSTGLWKRGG